MNRVLTRESVLRRCAAFGLALFAFAAPALADDACSGGAVGCEQGEVIRVELNRLEPAGEACRPNLVLVNGTALTLASSGLTW